MVLLFVFGVMNLAAITLITVAVIVEKTLPYGDLLGRIGGTALVLWGGLLFVG